MLIGGWAVPQVKEYGDKQAAVREAQAAVKAAVQGSEETEADLTNLYEELTVQRAILDKWVHPFCVFLFAHHDHGAEQ